MAHLLTILRVRNVNHVIGEETVVSCPPPVREREQELNFARQVSARGETGRQACGYEACAEEAVQPDSRGRDVFASQRSEKARQLLADIERVARCPYNILITGETGTGKTLAARQIHQRSGRAGKPFLELNCANLPEHLVEAELFGYRRGAFTGADRDHKGLFEEADDGILFLDEIGDVAPAVQNKLLKAIEEKQIKRLGTSRYVNCDVQIIAATSRDLPEMIRRGEFREDLYCRLAVLTIETAPLRERREDIPAIIDYYLRDAARAVSDSSSANKSYCLEQEAVELLCEFDYPGNIRVLRNLIYELTSHVTLDEPIAAGLVAAALDKIRARELRTTATLAASTRDETELLLAHSDTAASSLQDVLRSLANEGDIILPLEVCFIRQGETFRQWAARAKQCSIEAARQAAGGTLGSAARRLGATRSSLKGHLQRAKTAHIEASM
jgi:transcriptional regulator with GAF, ATPase, and Fis domain